MAQVYVDKKEEKPTKREYVPKDVVDEVLERVGEVRGRSLLGGAFCVAPGTGFVSIQGDEEAVLLLRSHPIVNLRWMTIAVVMLLVPGLLTELGGFGTVPRNFLLVGQLFWYLIVLAYVIESFLGWYYSVFIVTNERIVDIDFYNLLYREVSYVNLNHIEEPSMVTAGLAGTMFRYGNVRVPTAAEGPTVEGAALPYPDMVIRMISELSEELEKRRERGE